MKKFVLALFLIVLPGVLSVPTATAAFRYLHEGMKIPSLEGKDIITNQNITSEAYLKDNNMLIIVFWATWSKRSLEELKALKDISLQFGDNPMKIIAVNVDDTVISSTRRNKILQIIQDLELPFPTIIDNNLELFYKFGVIAVPSTAITDQTGTVRYSPAGFSLSTKDFVIDSIEVLLGLKDTASIAIAKKGYTPENKALRYYNLGLNLRHKRLYDRAISNIGIAIETDSTFPVPYSLLGEINLLRKNYTEAIAQYQIATTLDSEFVAAWSGLGQSYLMNSQLDLAENCLNKALSLDENFTPALISLSIVMSETGRTDSAKQMLLTAQELNPKDPILYYYMSEVFLKLQDTTSAIDQMRKALELYFPDN